jgi:hypothetical protein
MNDPGIRQIDALLWVIEVKHDRQDPHVAQRPGRGHAPYCTRHSKARHQALRQAASHVATSND